MYLLSASALLTRYWNNNFSKTRSSGKKMEEIERHTEDFNNTPQGIRERVQVTIPVVVNVVWNTASENISDAQIQSQIAVLNADFRALNADRTNTPAIFFRIDCRF
jgi:hypothetical protein